jgi:HK97 family phage portal protein
MFFTTPKAEDDRSPYSSFWFEPVGVNTAAGIRVTSDSAMTLSAIYAAVRLISTQMATLPFRLYKPRADGGKDIIMDHWLNKLFNVRPNKYMSPYDFREITQAHLQLRGNSYSQIIANRRGEITDLMPIHPDFVTIELLTDKDGQYTGDWRYQIRNRNGTIKTLSREQVWHQKALSMDGIAGMSPVSLARTSISIGIASQTYGARFFANDAKPGGGWIEYPGTYKDKTQRENIRESLQENQSAQNRGKLMLLDHGMKYHEVGLSNDDSQFLQTRQFEVTEIARWFGVPPHKIGDLSKATFTNIESQALEFIQDCLAPKAVAFESSVQYNLLDDINFGVELGFEALLRGDTAARTAYNNTAIMNGSLTRNEVRVSEGHNPLPGLDEPLIPLNMTTEAQQQADNEAAEKQVTDDDNAQDSVDQEEDKESDNTSTTTTTKKGKGKKS